MAKSSSSVSPFKNNIVRASVTIQGTRPLLQHQFGPDAIPLEKQEKNGVAGNDPTEWRRSCMLTAEGQMYVRGDYVFACLRNAARHTKKGRGSIQPLVEATLQVEELIVLLDRFLEPGTEPSHDITQPVYLDIRGVLNRATKGRNVRYRLAAGPGWKCTFTILWDKTVVDRSQMRSVVRDAGTLCGLGDGIRIGNGRFAVLSYEELEGAESETAEGTVGQTTTHRLVKGRKEVCAVPEATVVD